MKQDRRKPKATLYITNLSAEVKRLFKAHCSKIGKTMTGKIEEMMREEIKK